MVKRKSRYKRIYKQPGIFTDYNRESRQGEGTKYNFNYKLYIVFIVVAVLIYLVLFSKYFIISDVIVEGNELVDSEEIISALDYEKNIFMFDSDYYEKEIVSKIPEIKQVIIYKGFPNAIKIVILEHEKSLVWKSAEKYYLISSKGYAYKDITPSKDLYNDLPLVEDHAAVLVSENQQLVGPSFVAFIQNVDSQIKEVANLEPIKFNITETTVDVFLETDKGFYIKFDSMRSSKKQLDNLVKVLKEKGQDVHEYIDLRIDGWAYYK